MQRLLSTGIASLLLLAGLQLGPRAGRLAAQELSAAELQRQNDEWDARKVLHRSLALGALVGAGGSARLPAVSQRLQPSYGVNLRYEHPVFRYFVLGGNFDLQSWTTAPWARLPEVGRNTVFDLSLLAKLRVPVPNKAEFYLGVPVGVVLDAADNTAFGGRARTGLGYSLAGLLGARFFFSPAAGFVTELGVLYRSFQHVVVPTGAARYRIPVEMLQPVVMIALFTRV